MAQIKPRRGVSIIKLTVFGATGRTGQFIVQQALTQGHEIVAYVRTPSKLTVTHENMSIVQGDMNDAAQIEAAISGADAVISALGPTQNKPDYQLTRGIGHILAAMQTHDVKRIVLSTGAGVRDPQDQPGMFDKIMGTMLKLLAKHVLEDSQRMVEKVKASDSDWTIVRVPMLVDKPATGTIRAGYIGKDIGSRLTREDMATFMLAQVDDDRWLRQSPAISN